MQQKILVIDDEPQIRDLLVKFLTKLGYAVSTAESGSRALALIKEQAFSLVLCDIMMPEMDGLGTLVKIKKLNKSLPVVMMSGSGTHDRFAEAITQGAVDFIAKPLNLMQAKKVIAHALTPQINSRDTTVHLLREGYLGLLRIMIQTLETKDPYTKDHSRRVAEYAIQIAQTMKLPEGTIEVINYAGLLHDIGKIRVSDTILTKPGKLTAGEWIEMKMHPTTGSMIVEQLKLFRAEEPLIRHHHERFDGAGYPDGLANSRIPLGARILALADTYDALTSARPYRQAMDKTEAIKIIKDNRDTQFDPELTEVFLKTI